MLSKWLLPLLLIVFTTVILWIMSLHHRLKVLREDIQANWVEINHQLQRRYHLLEELCKSGRSNLHFEKDVVQRLEASNLRSEVVRKKLEKSGGVALDPPSFLEFQEMEKDIKTATADFIATLANYPAASSKEKTLEIEEELQVIENRIHFVLRSYNDSVMSYNSTQNQFPNKILSSILGHTELLPIHHDIS